MSAEPIEDQVQVHTDRASLCRAVARDLAEVLNEAIAERGHASAVLTGGGTGTGIVEAMADPEIAASVDWSAVHLWWGDERYLPHGDPERNEVQATAALLATLVTDYGLPATSIHRMPAAQTGSDATTESSAAVDSAAVEYAEQLAAHASIDPSDDGRLPVLDVTLLGMGDDAHVASLFPALPGPTVEGRTVIGVTDSPKPPPERISLTVEAINTSRHVWFVVAGQDKASAVAEVRAARSENRTDASRWPASVVGGMTSTRWHLDRASAGLDEAATD